MYYHNDLYYLLWFHVKKATNNWYATISILEKQSKHRATSVNVLLVEKRLNDGGNNNNLVRIYR